MMKRRRIAVIAAGGHAKRLGGLKPKPFMEVGDHSYFEILLNELQNIKFDLVLIYCDRTRYLRGIHKSASGLANATVICDRGVVSTIELVKHAASLCLSSDLVFFYGHAPRPSEAIAKIVNAEADCAATAYQKSTKAIPVALDNGLFIEPPLKVDSNLIGLSDKSSWLEFFDSIKHDYLLFESDAPAEFNTQSEEMVYKNYVETWHTTSSDSLTNPCT